MDTLEKIPEDIEEIKEENQNVVDNLNIDSLSDDKLTTDNLMTESLKIVDLEEDTLNDEVEIIEHIENIDSDKLENDIVDSLEPKENITDIQELEIIENEKEEEIIEDNNSDLKTEEIVNTPDDIDNDKTEKEDESNNDINILDKDLVNNESYQVLLNYGENFTTKEYLTNPAIGRDKEIQELIVTLLTPEKSGILVGKPGIGKTAIVEGLGYRIKNNNVPDALKGYSIFKLNTASLTGTMPNTNELKIHYIVNHLKNLDKIMIFIDEIHTLIGNSDNSLDFANIFKPIIDRGTIKIIGATTSDEYDRYILRDKAFVRRFQKIDVSEPTREMVIQIMMGTYPKFEKKMGLKLKYTDFIKENIMAFITDLTSEFRRVYEISARYPDISLTILQQAFSYAAFDNRKEVNIRDIRKAIATTKLVYPDVIKKELVHFNEVFRDVYLMETKQILKDEE